MGYKETFLVPMGTYTADEVVAKGPPDTVMIRARSGVKPPIWAVHSRNRKPVTGP